MPHAAIEVLHANNPAEERRWADLVRLAQGHDVYYLPAYARATATLENTTPVALVLDVAGNRFLLPVLIRRVANPELNLSWKDAASPYGYGGLLPIPGGSPVLPDEMRELITEIRAWCAQQQLICCVVRLHPLSRQEEYLHGLLTHQSNFHVTIRGSTFSIDLQGWDDAGDRPCGMRKNRRSALNRARRSLHATWSEGSEPEAHEHLRIFAEIYGQTMKRLNAEEFYHFPTAYWSHLMDLGRHLGVGLAWLGNQPVGGIVLLRGPNYGHYHVSGTNDLGRRHEAATLLVIEGARWARAQGCKLLHLGGGMSSGDSLAEFKHSFGGPEFTYSCLVVAGEEERFAALCSLPASPWPYSGKGCGG